MEGDKIRSCCFHRHPRLILLGCSLLGICLVLVLAEIAARLLLPQWAPTRAERVLFWTYDSGLGWVHRPHRRGQFSHPDFSVSVQINSRGLRDREYDLARNDKKRMLILGDSFGWGFGVECEERFSEILERKHPDWEVINASVSGYATDQEYLFFKNQGIAYRPDLVVLVVHDTDFSGNVCSVQYGYNKPYFAVVDDRLELRNSPVPPASLRQRAEQWLIGHTYLWRRLYFAGTIAVCRMQSAMGIARNTSKSGAIHEQKKIMSCLISSLQGLCAQSGAQLIVVSCPMHEELRDCLQQACLAETVSYHALDAALSESPEPTVFPHDPHWNRTGHRVVADALDAFFRQQKIFPVLPASSIP